VELTVEIVEFGRLTDAYRADLEGDEDDPFDGAEVTLRYRPKERHVALQDDRGHLIASAGMLIAEVEVAGGRFPVVGFGGVIVNAAYRGRGLARRIVGEAIARARRLGPDFVLLFCRSDRVGLYQRLGFTEITDPVEVEQPGGYELTPDVTMWRALTPDAQFPCGPVRLHDLPF
jgi:predicted N-acetyltransferase YhbS